MKLSLPIPADWDAEPSGVLTAYLPRGVAGLRILVTPLLPYPEDPQGWLRRQFSDGVPPGTKVQVFVSTPLATADGWPALVTEGLIGEGPTAEARVVVQYRFLDHGAAAIVRCVDPAVFEARRGAILDVLGHARPDWSHTAVLSLAELFDGVVRPDAAALGSSKPES